MPVQPTPLITTTLLIGALWALLAGRYRGVDSWRISGLFVILLTPPGGYRSGPAEFVVDVGHFRPRALIRFLVVNG